MVDLGPQEKHALIGKHARPYGVLVETGLWNGGGASTSYAGELACYAIDMDGGNVAAANLAGVRAWEGDSGILLAHVLTVVDRPCCLWLDAHYAVEGGDTLEHVRAHPCPLLDEIEAVQTWGHGPASTVLIDDVRCFGSPGWPSLDEVTEALGATWDLELFDDILRCMPRGGDAVSNLEGLGPPEAAPLLGPSSP